MRLTRFTSLTFLLILFASACDTPRVTWRDPMIVDAPASATRLVIVDAGAPRLVADSIADISALEDSTRCATSVRTARAGSRLYAVWWSLRVDNSASLDAAWSDDDGHTWSTAAKVDSTDRSSAGCNRPPPSVASSGKDLHIAYSMVAPEGTGVFFSHYMDGMFHSPVPVIYGERLVHVAIAADGNRVAVAYEEPNGTRRRVDVALSETQGHIFEWHGSASRAIDGATRPAIALYGPRIAVAWSTSREGDPTVTHVVRDGMIR